jgi:hypothetical protein
MKKRLHFVDKGWSTEFSDFFNCSRLHFIFIKDRKKTFVGIR